MNDNPTESDTNPEDPVGRDINAEKEALIRKYQARQRKLHKESLRQVADMGQAYNKFVLACGANEVPTERRSKSKRAEGKKAIDKELSRQALGTTMFEKTFHDLYSVLSNNGLIDDDK